VSVSSDGPSASGFWFSIHLVCVVVDAFNGTANNSDHVAPAYWMVVNSTEKGHERKYHCLASGTIAALGLAGLRKTTNSVASGDQ
jgi:hypothetical protein